MFFMGVFHSPDPFPPEGRAIPHSWRNGKGKRKGGEYVKKKKKPCIDPAPFLDEAKVCMKRRTSLSLKDAKKATKGE